jgi:hypothetical protein
METSAAAVCRKCGAEVYTESIIEQDGVPVERIVSGTFRQALDPDGLPYGPVIPFCKEH